MKTTELNPQKESEKSSDTKQWEFEAEEIEQPILPEKDKQDPGLIKKVPPTDETLKK